MGFAQNLDYLMQAKGMTKYQIAKAIGCHQTSVTNWLENGTVPQKRTLGAISELFGMSIEELCSDELPVMGKKENPTVSGEVLDVDIDSWLDRRSDAELLDIVAKVTRIMQERK